MKIKNINDNYKLMNEIIKKQVDLWNSESGDIDKEDEKEYMKLHKRLMNIGEILDKQFKKMNKAKSKKDGKIYKVKDTRNLINAVILEGKPMDREKLFNEYIVINE